MHGRSRWNQSLVHTTSEILHIYALLRIEFLERRGAIEHPQIHNTKVLMFYTFNFVMEAENHPSSDINYESFLFLYSALVAQWIEYLFF